MKSHDRPVDTDQFRWHAANLETLCSLLGDLRWAIWDIGEDQTAFGSVSQDAVSGLGDLQVRRHEAAARLEEDLLRAMQGLRNVAEGRLPLKRVILREEPDVMMLDGTPVIEEPENNLDGLMDTVIAHVQRRDWIHPLLNGAAPVAEFAAAADTRRTALRIAGLHCAMVGVDGLAGLIDDLTGSPEQLTGRAGVWAAVSSDLEQIGCLLRECLDEDIPRQDRQDVRSYLAMMTNNVDALAGEAQLARALSIITQSGGDLILLTRDIVRGIIADLFAQAVIWIAGSADGRDRLPVAAQLGVVVATVWRIQFYLDALEDSMSELSRFIDG